MMVEFLLILRKLEMLKAALKIKSIIKSIKNNLMQEINFEERQIVKE